MKRKVKLWWQAQAPLSVQEKRFTLFAMFSGFCISAEYAITRPASSAIFLSTFHSEMIPWVWLISVPINLSVIYLYNLFLPKLGPLKMVQLVGGVSIGINLLSSWILLWMPEWIFVQFLWKDIYILLMFKQLWSMIHSTIVADQAKYLYGVIFFAGTLGSVFGSFIPSFFALELGSRQLFLLTLPVYSLFFLAYRKAFSYSTLKKSVFIQDLTPNPHPKEAFQLIQRSKFLLGTLFLVLFMQVSVGLMDYQFNVELEANIADLDHRTQYCGQLVGLTNLCSATFQFLGGVFLVHFLGLKGAHLFVPLILLSSASVSWMFPSFMMVSLSYVFLKSIDFSIFGVLREMLYVPMKLDEKFRAKALIDVFAYRSSKALVSCLILGLQFFAFEQLLFYTKVLSGFIYLLWMAMIFFMFRSSKEAVHQL